MSVSIHRQNAHKGYGIAQGLNFIKPEPAEIGDYFYARSSAGGAMVKSDARSKPKKKSVKAKATGFGSARKLSRMGKRQAKGAKGIAANYITRSQILKRLQITLR